jgi:hypothetical protein
MQRSGSFVCKGQVVFTQRSEDILPKGQVLFTQWYSSYLRKGHAVFSCEDKAVFLNKNQAVF